MVIEELQNNYKTQNNTWTNPQIKDHKKSYELRLTRPQTPHMKPEQTYLKFLAASVALRRADHLSRGVLPTVVHRRL